MVLVEGERNAGVMESETHVEDECEGECVLVRDRVTEEEEEAQREDE